MSEAAESGFLPRARGLTLLSAQKSAGTLTVLAAFLACAASGELGVFPVIAFVASLAGSFLAGGRFAHQYAVAWTTLLLAALVILGLQVLGGSLDIVLGAAWFVVLLTVHRSWNRSNERDELLFLLLALLLLCAGAALSAELLFGFAFGGFAVAGTWALALTHLRFRIEAAKGPEAEGLLRSRRLISPALLGALGGLSLLGLIGATAVFFIFPRVTLGGLRRASRATPQVGLSDRVDLRGHGTLSDDPRVVLRARLDPDPQVEELAIHWRARAFEDWTGSGWTARSSARRAPFFRMPLALRGQRVWSSADIEAVSGFSDGIVLVPAGWTVGVRFVKPLTARPSQQQLLVDETGDLFYAPAEVGDQHYLVTVQPLASASKLLAEATPLPEKLPPEATRNLAVPSELDPRIRALGERLARGKPPAVAAEAVRTFLETSYTYTRELPGEQADPIAHFLFERRQGHCELFSSAMVLMLRSAGIPARNVTGYYGGERTGAGYYAVRGGDAHSWVEVWVPDLGFVSFDPTPAGERGGHQKGLWPSVVLAWDGLSSRWRAMVVDFDLLSQARAVQDLGALLRDATRRLSGKAGPGAPRVSGPLVIVAVLAAALGALWFARRLRWRRQVQEELVLSPDQERAQALLRKARERLRKAGLALPKGQTARELEALVHRTRPDVASALEQLVARCSQSRWGGAPLPQAVARSLLRTLEQRLE